MKPTPRILAALGIACAAGSASAATIEYTYTADLAFALDGTQQSTSVVISGQGDTENSFSIDSTRIANAFTGTFAFGSTEVRFTETVYAVRSGGTLAFVADISGLNIGTILSGNTVPVGFDLVSEAAFTLELGTTFGSIDTDSGLLQLFSFRADSGVTFRSELLDDPAAVPLPASMPLLLAGLALMGGAGLRRSKRTT